MEGNRTFSVASFYKGWEFAGDGRKDVAIYTSSADKVNNLLLTKAHITQGGLTIGKIRI